MPDASYSVLSKEEIARAGASVVITDAHYAALHGILDMADLAERDGLLGPNGRESITRARELLAWLHYHRALAITGAALALNSGRAPH